jgi:hypothetical protein
MIGLPMNEKNKNQPYTLKRVLLNLLLVFWIFPVGYGILFWMESRPVRDKIESQFSITLPANTRDMQYWSQYPDRYVTLVRFTVDIADLDKTMNSVEYERHYCLSETRQENFMPDFYMNDTLDWWNPQQAAIFDGVSCLNEDERNYNQNKHIMVDLSNPSEAIVYIEKFATHYGERYKFD